MSAFRTEPVNTATPPATPPPDTPPPDTPPELKETEPTRTTETPETPAPSPDMVTLPDGSQMSAKSYIDLQMAQANNGNSNPELSQPPEPPKDPAWKVNIEDEDAFQSDVEKSLVNAHNALGEQVTETLDKIERQVQENANTATREQTDRQIAEIERTQGVTEAELIEVYNEYGRKVDDVNALAEIAVARKAAKKQSEENTKKATDERKTQASTMSGGGSATPTGSNDAPPGRGLEGKDIYLGAKIAAQYKAPI